MERKIMKAAKTLWDYLKLDQPLKKCDCVLAMGSHDLRVADYAASLILEGWAPLLICSGGLGRLTKEIWQECEADKFSKIAENTGIPKSQILIENRSTNTSENILFSKKLLKQRGFEVKSAILVHKPYMERRAYATARLYWPELKVTVSSPDIAFEKYPSGEISLVNLIQIMAGDFQRILVYPAKGFQIKQKIDAAALNAFNYLVENGFTQYLINGQTPIQ